MNPWNSDPSFNKITSSYFKDLIDLSGNFIIRNGTIKSPANTIEFDDTYSFINIPNSLNVLTQLKTNYDSIEYDVGFQCEKVDTLVSDVAILSPIVSDTQFKLTNMYYDSALNSTIFSNNVSFGNGTIASIAINNSDNRYVDIASAQTISGAKTFTGTPVFPVGSIPINRISGTAVNTNGAQSITATKSYSVVQNFNNNIRLDGSLLVGTSGGTTILNSTLVKLNNISDTTSAVGANLTSLQSQITNINGVTLAGNNTYTGTNTYSNTVQINNTLTISVQSAMAKFQTYDSGRSWSSGGVSDFVFEYSSNYVDRGITIQAGRDNTGSAIFGMYFLTDVLTNATARVPIMYSTNTASQTTNVLTISSGTLATTNIRLDGALSLNSNALSIPNTTLQKLQYISTISSDIQIQTSNNATNITTANTNITTLTTKLTDISYASSITTIANTLASSTFTFSTSINGTTKAIFDNILLYCNSLSGNVQTALTNNATNITTANTNITTLTTKLTDISYASSITTIANTLASSTLTFSTSINGTTKAIFDNILLYCNSLSGNVQTALTNLSYSVNPVASIIMSPMSDIQTTSSNKYLLCDGQSVGRSSYPNLFAKIGTSFGSADSFTFNVPNYQGAFLRGYGQAMINGQIYEGNFTVNTPQQDAIQEHKHWGQSGSYCGTNRVSQPSNGFSNGTSYPQTYNFDQTGLQSSGRSDAGETRPMNYSVYYYIKS